MNTGADKTQKNTVQAGRQKNRSVANEASGKQSGGESKFQFVDNRPEAIAQRKIQEIADIYSDQQHSPTQNKENRTGLPHKAWHTVQQKQGRVKPTAQMKGKLHVNDDKGLEKEADVMGMKANQDKNHIDHAPIQKRSAGYSPVVQLKPETVKITGLTHLVQMDNKTIFGSKKHKTVKSGDLVTIEPDETYKSRRGPNQEDPELRKTDRDGEHIYTWFQTKDVNGEAVGAGNFFLRDLTFKRSPTVGAFDEEKDQLVNQKDKLANFKQKARLVIENLKSVLDGVKDHPGFADYSEGIGNVDGAYKDLLAGVNMAAPGGLAEVARQYGDITGQMKQLYEQLETQAYASKSAEEPEMGRSLIAIADQAFRVSEIGEHNRSNPTGEEITTENDARGEGFGIFDATQTGIYGIGGGILGTPGVFATGSFGAGFATGFAYVAGPLGIICGLVGIGLGIRVAWNGNASEKKLKKLIPSLDQADVKRIAAFAAEKKRKKKWGGAIVITTGVAAVIAGGLGIAALSIATLGVGAAVLGIGVALIGLSIGIGKLIQRARKRKKWRGKMAAMVIAAVESDESNAFPQNIMALGKTVTEQNEGSGDYTTAMTALKNACVQMAESRRSLLALDAVRFLLNGTPGQKYEASLVIEALKVSTDKISEAAQNKGENAAASLIARKMKSW